MLNSYLFLSRTLFVFWIEPIEGLFCMSVNVSGAAGFFSVVVVTVTIVANTKLNRTLELVAIKGVFRVTIGEHVESQIVGCFMACCYDR